VNRDGAVGFSSWLCTFTDRNQKRSAPKNDKVEILRLFSRDASCLLFPRLFPSTSHFTSSMPTSTRKSSLGAARRAQQRAHLPFRADDLGLGKRTGLPVPTIEHKSDDFEPFDEILSRADTRAAWHGQNKRPGSSKKRKSIAPLYEDDDGGEMSMELDDYSKLRVSIRRISRRCAKFSHHSSETSARWTYQYERRRILLQYAPALITSG
jgi:hypothetical protein